MTITTQKHLVVLTSKFWGHTRPMCTLVTRIVKLRRNIVVTFFVALRNYNSVKAEIARDFVPGQEHLISRIRLIGLEDTEEAHDDSTTEHAFEEAWIKIFNDQPLVCAKTGKQFETNVIHPSAALFDLFVVNPYDVVKKLSPNPVKLFAWFPIAVQCIAHPIFEDHEAVIRAEAARRGLPFGTVAYEMLNTQTGRVIRTACTPPMHDWEFRPQEFTFPEITGGVMIGIGKRLRIADGLVTFDAAEYCPDATKMLREWLAGTSRKAYLAGPLVPQCPEDTSNNPRSGSIFKFLDEKLASHGKHSVIYISFGSLFWPTDPAKVQAMLEVIMEKNIPFVMSGASAIGTTAFASTSASHSHAALQEKISQYANAIMAQWVPQQALLAHPATGWYISHGGHNGTLETIMAGVPTIVWPIDADQPLNAIHLSETLDVAYELVEVRNGVGAGKIFRNGRTPIGTVDAVKEELRDILERAFGEDGARKRANLEIVRKKLQAAWQEGGIGQREVEAFADDF